MSDVHALTHLTPGQPIVFGGNRVVSVGVELADAFRPGDRLVVVQATGALVHIPSRIARVVDGAISAATVAFTELARCDDEAIATFFETFAARLDDDPTFAPIAAANARDVDRAAGSGRSTTRLELTPRMRADMIDGLRVWRDQPGGRGAVESTIGHDGWTVEARREPVGVVGFVFEGRPNVFADACGVVRSGNAVVFRIGSDALGTARAIVEHALAPALAAAGLPAGTVQLIDEPARSGGHALFDDPRLALAVARGSGAAVAELGAVAAQAGTPVSLHGTGGAWMIVGEAAEFRAVRDAVVNSLDRKVCNTLNVCAIPQSRADMVPVFLEALDAVASRLGADVRLHVVAGSEHRLPAGCFDRRIVVERAAGPTDEPFASTIEESGLATEWEWERSPELTLVVTPSVADAVTLCNRYGPHFVTSVITADPVEFERCYGALDTPFTGNGFTRWVDGQYALDRPELGLANWQGGRLLGRGAILSGDSVYTVRYVARIDDTTVRR
ncbi:MAG: aldehyde dehydrogenase family protein [Ilumatobacteraceae bacterium]